MLTRCKKCRCYVETAFGADQPAAHTDAAGTKDDPRSPGDRDDICDACCYDFADEHERPDLPS